MIKITITMYNYYYYCCYYLINHLRPLNTVLHTRMLCFEVLRGIVTGKSLRRWGTECISLAV